MAPALAGHEVSYYPSFYPQEIRFEPLDPGAAAREFDNKTDPLHAYIGGAPRFPGQVPARLKSVESLGSFIVATANPDSRQLQDRDARCRALAYAAGALRDQAGVIPHPYPITPFHADYLFHADLIPPVGGAQRAEQREPFSLAFRTENVAPALAGIVPARTGEWDIGIKDVAPNEMPDSERLTTGAWLAPPWAKEGWHQAYRLLRPAIRGESGDRADALYDRLTHGVSGDEAERHEVERELVTVLRSDCRSAVVGYRLRTEFYNDESVGGVENIAVDSQAGFNSAMFLRTVKLKDFPWNGWLRLGIDADGRAAWNPVGGFTDAAGRLVWSTVADDAFLPVPYNSRWAPNRADLHAEEGQKPTQSLRIPADALVPEQGRSRLVAAPGGSAMAKLAYKVQLSAFHDGSDMEPADLLYPIAFAFRWGGDPASRTFDPEVARRTALLRERLKAVQILRTEESKLEVADLTFVKRAAIVEVYIDDPLASDHESAVLTPPWSAIPWHLLALMESAVERGIAAFSRSEAERRGVPWLDLVRDPAQTEKMAALVREFAATGYVPEALKDLVSVENAKGRWRALEKFIDANNHLLVTNGPYRLKQYARDAFVFEVVRDFTYPIGIGTFDLYTYPPRVLITAMEQAGNNVMVSADVEMEIKAQRVHRRVREPLKRDTLRDVLPINPSARYVVVAGDGKLIASGAAAWQRDGRFQISLPPGLGAGGHTLFVAVFPGGNTIRPDIGRIGLRQN